MDCTVSSISWKKGQRKIFFSYMCYTDKFAVTWSPKAVNSFRHSASNWIPYNMDFFLGGGRSSWRHQQGQNRAFHEYSLKCWVKNTRDLIFTSPLVFCSPLSLLLMLSAPYLEDNVKCTSLICFLLHSSVWRL